MRRGESARVRGHAHRLLQTYGREELYSQGWLSSPDARNLEENRFPRPIGSLMSTPIEQDAAVDDPQVEVIARTDGSGWRVATIPIDRLPSAVCSMRADGPILAVSPAFEELLGRPRSLVDACLPTSHSVLRTALLTVAETGVDRKLECDAIGRNGEVIPLEISVSLFDPSQGLDHAADSPASRSPHLVSLIASLIDLRPRRDLERALKRTETRFQDVFDEAPFGYHEIDSDGILTRINLTECELLGYRRDDVIGASVFDFVAPAFRDAARKAVKEKIQGTRALLPFERTYVKHDGGEIIVAIEERLIRDELGRVLGLRSIVRDITATKQSEAALVASERRARALFEGIADPVFVHALDGRILDANPVACATLGYTRDELLSLTTREIDDPEFAEGYEERKRQQLNLGRFSCQGRHRAKDGRIIPVEINTTVIDFDGQSAVLAVIRDLTERIALEETRRQFLEATERSAREIEAKNRELTRSEERYRQLTHGCLDAVVVCDPKGLITLFNPAAEQIFGYSAEQTLGIHLADLITDGLPPPHDETLARWMEQRDPRLIGRTIDLKGKKQGGEVFPLEISLSAVNLDGQWHCIGSIRDQTERQRMRAMIVQTEKLASIGLLSAGVAHEINNPLAYVANNLAVLERDLKGVMSLMESYESAKDALEIAAPAVAERVAELSDEIDWPYIRDNYSRVLTKTRDGVQRVANIVQSLRGLARTSAPKLETLSLTSLLASPMEMIRNRIRRQNIEFAMEGDALEARITCDPSQISQVFLNLLVNAVQAIETVQREQPGKLTIRGQFRHELNQKWVVTEIHDTGEGIDPQHLPRLFDPFFTTKPVGEGTGLGLSISHEIVNGHGGRIEVESEVGKGTCFRVILPVSPSRAESVS